MHAQLNHDLVRYKKIQRGGITRTKLIAEHERTQLLAPPPPWHPNHHLYI